MENGGKKRKEERLMEVGVGVNDGKCVCCTPLSLSLSLSVPLSLCLLLSHSDMSIRRCFIGMSNDGRCCQGNYIAH